jgi:glyoxylase-like metal-dependent hydrolase (beta-lactamase superfamily II)
MHRFPTHSRRGASTSLMATAIVAAIAAGFTACASVPGPSLDDAARIAGAQQVHGIEFAGTGRWYQFGQAPAPGQPWPPFEVSRYTSTIDFDAAAARVQITRSQVVEAGRARPAPVQQQVDQAVKGTVAWNRNANGSASAQPAALEERTAEIWSTPQGFIKAAIANQAVAQQTNGHTELSFTTGGKYRYVGTLDAQGRVERVRTWIDTPVLGDTLLETRFSGYKDFGGVQFPSRIERTKGGHPVLDLQVTQVRLNPAVDSTVPREVANAQPPAVTVASAKLADGVYYLTGGTHHSVLVEQADHLVIVEAPLNEERSRAVIAKAREIAPNKPIRTLVNTHAHFDHSGGLRTYVDEGATIVTQRDNRRFYEESWAAPRRLNPDALAKSGKAAKFETFDDKLVLQGEHPIEIHRIAGSGHNDAFALVYLPKEKMLVEADAFTPLAAGAPAPASANPYSQNLLENIQKLNLDVAQIAALHGPRVTTVSDLKTYVGLK